MYAIIGTGGKQYRVMKGDLVKIELLPTETESVTFAEVYLVGNGRDTVIGNPVVPGAKVTATVTGTGRRPKVLVFKMKRRKQYKRTIGHRQYYTSVRIDDIDSGGAVQPLEGAATIGKTRQVARQKAAAKKAAHRKKSAARKAAAGSKTSPAKRPSGGKKTATRKAGTRRTAGKKAGAGKKAPTKKTATKKTTAKKTATKKKTTTKKTATKKKT